jgi:hypothetical protein
VKLTLLTFLAFLGLASAWAEIRKGDFVTYGIEGLKGNGCEQTVETAGVDPKKDVLTLNYSMKCGAEPATNAVQTFSLAQYQAEATKRIANCEAGHGTAENIKTPAGEFSVCHIHYDENGMTKDAFLGQHLSITPWIKQISDDHHGHVVTLTVKNFKSQAPIVPPSKEEK